MIDTIKTKPERHELKPGEILCEYCTAKCCRYFALPIDEPTKRTDYEFIRWFLLHGQATVFIEDETWYLMIHTKCKHLQDDNRCGIYETRPDVCREYTIDECEYEDDWVYEHYWETPEQVAEYAEAVLRPQKGQSIRSRRPPLLPILG